MMVASFTAKRIAWATLALLLAGCQTMGAPGGGQTDPRLANSSSAQFFSKSGWQACAGGAVVGVLACQLANPDRKGACMATAAVVGCGVGMGANYYLDQRRSQYANAEQRLDVAIADVRKDNLELQDLSRTARTVIADDRQSIAMIQRDIAAKRVQRAHAQQRLAKVDANLVFLRDKLANARTKQQEWRKVAAAERSSASAARLDTLNAEINSMQRQIGSLEAEIDQLYKQRSAIRLG
ncbi:hypothetical protein [Azotobacter beijerinckii]|uniref:Lipoprotein n=1 Tax=Azotobacter beijerinckii TaxID=170623 RepID=A0A1H9B3F6_9GAMM|nr:hypothetical protein [Azotobacter beijerinckii]MDV7213313.1 hypothetical protein [Azotobacter beijerinckii]SEP83267.1 hypothetical protein SAMN04244573_00554 [Azotobacter beijerinckii]